MAVTGIFHHIATFFLLVATALLLVTTITAPVINDISILRVSLQNGTSSSRSAVSFGTFGYCVLNVKSANDDDDYCTKVMIGYNPLKELASIQQTNFNDAQENTSQALTRVMVLHPVACGLSFIAFLLAIGSGFIGALAAAIFSTLSLMVTVVVLATDFTLFGIVRNKLNDMNDGRRATWGAGIWTLLAALVMTFLATILVVMTCCSSRLHKKRANNGTLAHGEKPYTTTTTKRHFWQRKSRSTRY